MARRAAPAPDQLDLFRDAAGQKTPADPCKISIGWEMRDDPERRHGFQRRLMYHAVCKTCGTHSSEFDHENRAVEQGMDHAWPGWRELPAVPAKPAEGDQSRWLAGVAALYPPGWVEAGGPVRAIRYPPGNRHHWDAALGYWDLGVSA